MSLPEHSLLISETDPALFACWYFQGWRKQRLDVAVVPGAMLQRPWVRRQLELQHPGVVQPNPVPGAGEDETAALMGLLSLNLGRRIVALSEPMNLDGWGMVPQGLAYLPWRTRADRLGRAQEIGRAEGLLRASCERGLDKPGTEDLPREGTFPYYFYWDAERNFAGLLAANHLAARAQAHDRRAEQLRKLAGPW